MDDSQYLPLLSNFLRIYPDEWKTYVEEPGRVIESKGFHKDVKDFERFWPAFWTEYVETARADYIEKVFHEKIQRSMMCHPEAWKTYIEDPSTIIVNSNFHDDISLLSKEYPEHWAMHIAQRRFRNADEIYRLEVDKFKNKYPEAWKKRKENRKVTPVTPPSVEESMIVLETPLTPNMRAVSRAMETALRTVPSHQKMSFCSIISKALNLRWPIDPDAKTEDTMLLVNFALEEIVNDALLYKLYVNLKTMAINVSGDGENNFAKDIVLLQVSKRLKVSSEKA